MKVCFYSQTTYGTKEKKKKEYTDYLEYNKYWTPTFHVSFKIGTGSAMRKKDNSISYKIFERDLSQNS